MIMIRRTRRIAQTHAHTKSCLLLSAFALFLCLTAAAAETAVLNEAELNAALIDATVVHIIVRGNVSISPHRTSPTPIALNRNVIIEGSLNSTSLPLNWPILDFNFASRDRVRRGEVG